MEPFKNYFDERYKKEVFELFAGKFPNSKYATYFSEPAPFSETTEYRQRVAQISEQLFLAFNSNFETFYQNLLPILSQHQNAVVKRHIFFWEPFTHVIQTYGLDFWEKSIEGLAMLTQLFTAEFAIRPFIEIHEEKTLAQLLAWTQHPNEHLRRLASEGSRPRLPWGKKLNNIAQNPTLTEQILENLKADSSLYVRKSVANHLNDMSWLAPNHFYKIIERWKNDNPSDETRWIIKHALRSELKKGSKKALELLGYVSFPNVGNIRLSATPNLGGSVQLEGNITNQSNSEQPYMLDFVFTLPGKNKKREKVFKGFINSIQPNETINWHKTFPLKDNSVRKYYAGTYTIALMINGEIKSNVSFTV